MRALAVVLWVSVLGSSASAITAPIEVALQAYNCKYFQAVGGGGKEVRACAPHIKGWETFTMFFLEGGKVAFKASNGQYLRAAKGGGGGVFADADKLNIHETFTLQRVGAGLIALQSHNGKYLCADLRYYLANPGKDRVMANKPHIKEWETFRLIFLNLPGLGRQDLFTNHTDETLWVKEGRDKVSPEAQMRVYPVYPKSKYHGPIDGFCIPSQDRIFKVIDGTNVYVQEDYSVSRVGADPGMQLLEWIFGGERKKLPDDWEKLKNTCKTKHEEWKEARKKAGKTITLPKQGEPGYIPIPPMPDTSKPPSNKQEAVDRGEYDNMWKRIEMESTG